MTTTNRIDEWRRKKWALRAAGIIPKNTARPYRRAHCRCMAHAWEHMALVSGACREWRARDGFSK